MPNSSSEGSSRKGKAVEWFVAAHCILASKGKLNVSTSMVDDEGVDLVFNLKDTPKTLAVQVKSRFASGSLLSKRATFVAQVRKKALRPRPNLYILFVLFDDDDDVDVKECWLVPSIIFDQKTRTQTESRAHRVFSVNIHGTNNRWREFKCSRRDLAERIVRAIHDGNPD